mmetsp:Transcript_46880/g.135084  ORF Transcript_46880/g.135084 Transcript_46880/m.135084 type:complete len:493 (+) Transcript_46880:339-1817(+)
MGFDPEDDSLDLDFEAASMVTDIEDEDGIDRGGLDGPVEEATQLFAQTNVHDIPSSRYMEISAEEREAALQELHGALDLVHETPEFLESKLVDLEEATSPLNPFLEGYPQRKAYDLAVEQNSSYVKDLRLSFLRAEKFDVQKAAIRMFAHFETRSTLFEDPQVLGRDIRVSDFSSPDDKSLLERGFCQLLPHRDRVGRPIIFLYSPRPGAQAPYNFDSKLRIFFWMGLLATRMGEDIQRKGVVVVWHGISSKRKADALNGARYFTTMACMTSAVTSVHAVYDSPEVTKSFNTIVAKSDTSDYVFRFRTHYGPNIACLHSLMAYGIPRGSLPVNFDGTLRTDDYERFLFERAHQEKDDCNQGRKTDQAHDQPTSPPPHTAEDGTVPTSPPTEMDIICGRGQRGSKNPGNLLLKRLLVENASKYNKASRHGKAAVAQEIYAAMRQAGCRFLAPAEEARTAHDRYYVPELWKEVDEAAARNRIAHKFRNMRKTNS